MALMLAAGAAVAAAVEWVAWARHPRRLGAAGLPGAAPGRPDGSLAQRLRVPLRWVVAATLVTVTALLVAGAGLRVLEWSLGAALISYGARATAAGYSSLSRAFRGDPGLRGVIDAGVKSFGPEVLVHFSGSIRTVYQLDQWMPFVASSGLRTLLVLRESETFDAVAGRWEVPVVFIRDFPDLDLVVRHGVRVALYVNTSTKNNHLIRFESIVHTQMHHGDSDKPVSSSKTMRLYDHHLVAGPAGARRLLEAGVAAGPEAVSVVGRPQTHAIPSGPLSRETRTVLYAPTWEGFHVDAPVCSLAALGEKLARLVPRDMELVIRPHPLTGSVDRRLLGAMSAVRRALDERGPAGRFVDPETEDLAVTIAGADVLIADVSSVLVDFLAADRPAIVTDVTGVGAGVIHRNHPTTVWAGVLEPDLGNLDSLLEDAFNTDRRRDARRAAAAQFLGEVSSPQAAFHATLRSLVEGHHADGEAAPKS
jgi:hypothetical protein